jgi:hypothetical protein
MTKENVIKVREALGCGDRQIPLLIQFNNTYFAWEKNDIVKWDDDNELVILFKTNHDPQTMAKLPLIVSVVQYELIEWIHVRITPEVLEEVADSVSSNIVSLSDEEKIAIKNNLIAATDFFGDKLNRDRIKASENK